MINSIANLFINLFLGVVNILHSLVIGPLLRLFVDNFPSFAVWLSSFDLFQVNYLRPGIRFSRELFFNITHFPRDIFRLLVAFYLFKITLYITVKPIKFLLNIWGYYKTGTSSSSSSKSSNTST